MEDRLGAMQRHVADLQGEKVAAEKAWWEEKEVLMRGWSADHNRLMAMSGGETAGPMGPDFVPLPLGPPVAEAYQLEGDRMMHELAVLRHERSLAAVPERQAAEFRVRSLEVQLARENHAREFAAFANVERGMGAFRRELGSATPAPLGDKLNSQLSQSEPQALKNRVGELQQRVMELERQLAAK